MPHEERTITPSMGVIEEAKYLICYNGPYEYL